MPKLTKKFQIGWNSPGQVFETTDSAEMHSFVDQLLDAGASMIVINTAVEQDNPPEIAQLPTPIGG